MTTLLEIGYLSFAFAVLVVTPVALVAWLVGTDSDFREANKRTRPPKYAPGEKKRKDKCQ